MQFHTLYGSVKTGRLGEGFQVPFGYPALHSRYLNDKKACYSEKQYAV